MGSCYLQLNNLSPV
uniref:Uncharacterized protein n=1 Tax=Anguilla anguilla TaxID=7936 RepID=A0A0E9U809_ANGAN